MYVCGTPSAHPSSLLRRGRGRPRLRQIVRRDLLHRDEHEDGGARYAHVPRRARHFGREPRGTHAQHEASRHQRVEDEGRRRVHLLHLPQSANCSRDHP